MAIFIWLLFCFFGMLIKSSHLLSFLIGLEFLSLLIFFSFVFSYMSGMSVVLLMFFLLGAMGGESALGLILFVLFTRSNSKDYLHFLNLVKF